MGVLGYHCCFVPAFSHLAKILTNFTRKHAQFEWTSEHPKSFDTLKRALIEEPVLHLPVFKKPFQIFADTIDFAIGALHNQGGDGVYKPMH